MGGSIDLRAQVSAAARFWRQPCVRRQIFRPDRGGRRGIEPRPPVAQLCRNGRSLRAIAAPQPGPKARLHGFGVGLTAPGPVANDLTYGDMGPLGLDETVKSGG